jgi:flagellin
MLRTLMVVTASVVALTLTAGPAAANSILNGSFETGDFTNWSQFGETSFSGVAFADVNGVSPTDGSYQAFFGPFDFGGIVQDVGTTAGQSYVISFDLANLAGRPNFFDVSFDGVSLTSFTNASAFPYTHYVFTRTASGASSPLQFTFLDGPSFLLLDNVTVEAVPEPATFVLGMLGLGGWALRRHRGRA